MYVVLLVLAAIGVMCAGSAALTAFVQSITARPLRKNALKFDCRPIERVTNLPGRR